MKDTPQDPQSFDDAFDARCRDVLSQRSVPAPPFVPPATPAMGTGKKVILAAGAVALLAAGSFLWTADESAPVSAPASIEAPVDSAPVESTQENPIDVDPVVVQAPAAQETAVQEVAIGEATTSTEPAPNAAQPVTEPAEAVESTPVVVEVQPATAADVDESETPEVTPEVTPQVMEAEASDEVGIEPNAETPVEEVTTPAEENAQQPDAEKAPVLTLPITLPAGGGL